MASPRISCSALFLSPDSSCTDDSSCSPASSDVSASSVLSPASSDVSASSALSPFSSAPLSSCPSALLCVIANRSAPSRSSSSSIGSSSTSAVFSVSIVPIDRRSCRFAALVRNGANSKIHPAAASRHMISLLFILLHSSRGDLLQLLPVNSYLVIFL